MALTFRDIKGEPLSHEEVDANFRSFYYSSSINNNILVLYKPDGTEVDISVATQAFGEFLANGGSIADVFIGDGQITGSTLIIDFRSASLYDKTKAPGSTYGVDSRLLADENYITLEPDNTYYPFYQHFGSTYAVSSSGQLIASGARLEGSITASSGLIGGFEIKNDVLVSRPGGAFASSIFISGSPSINGTFINSDRFKVRGNGDITGSAVLFTGGRIAGWEIDSSTISKNNVVLDSTDGSISLNNSTFGSNGIQLQQNNGSPRFYAGNGSTNFIKYDGTNVEIETGKFELDANNIEISSLHSSMSLGEGNIVMYGDISRIDVGAANKVVIQGGATDNFIRMGSKTDFNQFSAAGIIIGMNNTVPTLDLTKDANNYVRFDSTNGVDIKTSVFSLDTDYIDIDSETQRIQVYNTASAEIIRMGEISDDASDLYGLKIYDGLGTTTDNAIAMFGQQGNKIAGWEVTNTQIRSIPDSGFGGQYAEGETGLVMHSSGRIESSDFVSGLKGWRIDTLGNGSAEFENVRVRGTLRTTVFEKESVNVVGGQLMVSNGTTIQALRSGSTIIAGSPYVSNTATTMSVANVSGFARGEILMAKKVDDTGFSVEYMYVTGSKRFSEDPNLAYITGSVSGSGNPPIDPDGVAGELYIGRAYGSIGPSSISASLSTLSADMPMVVESLGETGILQIDSTGSLQIQDVIKVGDERMKITNISGSGTQASASLTVIRDFADTQPAPHNAGDVVYKVDLDREFLAGLVSTASEYYEGQVIVSTGKYSVGTSYNDKFPYLYNVTGTPNNNGEYKFLSGSTHITSNITGSTSLQIYSNDISGSDHGSFLGKFDKGSYIVALIDGTSEWVRFRVTGNPTSVGSLHTFPISLNQDFYQAQSPATDTTSSPVDFWFLSNIQDVSSGYILANANPNDLYTPYIDIVERTGSGVYDLSLKTRLGDLSGLASPYLYGDEEPGFGIYTENGFFRGTVTAMTGSIAGILHVATEQGGIETGQKISIGRQVQGNNDGIYINNNNYWYTDAAFKVGGQNNYVTLDNFEDGNLQIRVQDFGLETDNMIISSSFDSGSIRIGVTATDITETANSGIYINGEGHFRAGTGTGVAAPQYIHWNGSTLTVSGDINVIGGNAATTQDIANTILSGSESAEAARLAAVATGSVSASNAYSASVDYASSSISTVSGSFVDTIQTVDSKIFTNDRGRVTVPPTASTDGLYLGSTNLGFYGDGVWKTFMANNGNFFLTGSTGGYLTWNSATGELDVKGTVRATAGDIGGVQLTEKSTYVGTGNYGNTDTPYLLSSSGDFSLGDKLVWDASAGSLTIAGDITVTGGTAVTSTQLEAAKAEASSSAIYSASLNLNASSSALTDSINQAALTASLSASQAQSAAEATALQYVTSSITSLQSYASASVATLSSSLGAMSAIDNINSGNNTTYIGNEAIVTNLIAANALISTNYDAPDTGEIYSDAGMFIDFKNGNIWSPGFVVSGSDAHFRGTVTVGSTNLTEDNTINQADILGAGAVNYNPDLTLVGNDGRPGGIKAVYSSNVAADISYADAAKTQLKIASSTDSTIGAGWPAFKINTDARYLISLRVKSNTALTSGFYFRMQELDSELPLGQTHVSANASESEPGVQEATRQVTSFVKASDGTALDLDNIALGTSFTEYLFYYTPTSTCLYASPIILNWSGAGTNQIIVDRVHITPETLVKTRGSIGGWTIDSNAIYRGTELADDTFASSNGQITLGAGFIGAKQFKIASNGNATFRGLISGSTIEIGTTANNVFKANNDGISLGHSAFLSAPFRVTTAGELTATQATITGTITAENGSIGGWSIDNDAIYTGTKDSDGYTTSGITLDSGGSLHSKQFYIDTDGSANFKGSISGGTINIGSRFSVDADGNLTASNATLSGNIEITDGSTFETINTAFSSSATALSEISTVSGSVNNLTVDVSNALFTASAASSSAGQALVDASYSASAAEANAYAAALNLTASLSSSVAADIFTDGNGNIIKPANPGSAGLKMGKDQMGYWDGDKWMTFMGSNGDFFLSGSGGGLAWDSSASELVVHGIISASAGYFTGSITSDATITGGTVSGGSIEGGTITIGSGNDVFKADSNGIYLGSATFSNAEFRVTPQGTLTATNANINGTITSGDGTIGGFTLGSSQLYTGNKDVFTSSLAGVYVGNDGIALGTNSPFKVTSGGTLTANDVNITGVVNIDTGTFSGGITSDATITGGTISGSVINGGQINVPDAANPKFTVNAGGILTAVDAVLSGSISADSGDIGGWEIGNNQLASPSVNNPVMKLTAGASPVINVYSGSNVVVDINSNNSLTDRTSGGGSIDTTSYSQTTSNTNLVSNVAQYYNFTYFSGASNGLKPSTYSTLTTAGAGNYTISGTIQGNANVGFFGFRWQYDQSGSPTGNLSFLNYRVGFLITDSSGTYVGVVRTSRSYSNSVPRGTYVYLDKNYTENISGIITLAASTTYRIYPVIYDISGTFYGTLSGTYDLNIDMYTPQFSNLGASLSVNKSEISPGGLQVVSSTNNYVVMERDVNASGITAVMLDVGGSIQATGNITANASDKRLKNITSKIENPLEKISKLNGVLYTWNELAKQLGNYDTDTDQVGLIAQEVQEVLPEATTLAPFDNLKGESKSGENYLTIWYERLVPLIIEGVKELAEKVDKLERENEELRNGN